MFGKRLFPLWQLRNGLLRLNSITKYSRLQECILFLELTALVLLRAAGSLWDWERPATFEARWDLFANPLGADDFTEVAETPLARVTPRYVLKVLVHGTWKIV